MEFKIIVMDGDPADREEAIRLTADALYEEGCVNDDFYDACIEREKIYPTGIPSIVPVAIPHADACNVIEKAICILRLKKPVIFHSMENVENELAVSCVFNLAVNEGKDQLKMLQAVIRLARDHEGLTNAQNMTLQEMKEFFVSALTDKETK